jgi:hypothetical protein
MKTKFIKAIFTTLIVLGSLSAQAQSNPSNPEGEDDMPTAASIDAALPLLMIGAVIIGGFVFLNKYKKEQVLN